MRLVVIAAVLLSVLSCSKSTPSPASGPAPDARSEPRSDAQSGTVTGTAGAGAVVVLEPKGERTLPASDTAVMDQVSLTFIPEILIVRTGQPAEFRNNDDTLHNVHVTNLDTKEPAFNVAIPTGEKYLYTFAKDGLYHVGCDIHPAMAAEIIAASTPFAMVTGSDGAFVFVDVPPGPYVLKSLSGGVRKERDVEVKRGANAVALAP